MLKDDAGSEVSLSGAGERDDQGPTTTTRTGNEDTTESTPADTAPESASADPAEGSGSAQLTHGEDGQQDGSTSTSDNNAKGAALASVSDKDTIDHGPTAITVEQAASMSVGEETIKQKAVSATSDISNDVDDTKKAPFTAILRGMPADGVDEGASADADAGVLAQQSQEPDVAEKGSSDALAEEKNSKVESEEEKTNEERHENDGTGLVRDLTLSCPKEKMNVEEQGDEATATEKEQDGASKEDVKETSSKEEQVQEGTTRDEESSSVVEGIAREEQEEQTTQQQDEGKQAHGHENSGQTLAPSMSSMAQVLAQGQAALGQQQGAPLMQQPHMIAMPPPGTTSGTKKRSLPSIASECLKLLSGKPAGKNKTVGEIVEECFNLLDAKPKERGLLKQTFELASVMGVQTEEPVATMHPPPAPFHAMPGVGVGVAVAPFGNAPYNSAVPPPYRMPVPPPYGYAPHPPAQPFPATAPTTPASGGGGGGAVPSVAAGGATAGGDSAAASSSGGKKPPNKKPKIDAETKATISQLRAEARKQRKSDKQKIERLERQLDRMRRQRERDEAVAIANYSTGSAVDSGPTQAKRRRTTASPRSAKGDAPMGAAANASTEPPPGSTTQGAEEAATDIASGAPKSASSGGVTWDTRFQELLHFQKGYGHCRVPVRYKANPALARWVSRMRQLYKELKNKKKADDENDKSDAGSAAANEAVAAAAAVAVAISDAAAGDIATTNVSTAAAEETATASDIAAAIGDAAAAEKTNDTETGIITSETPPLDPRAAAAAAAAGTIKAGAYTLNDERIAQLEAIGFEWEVLNFEKVPWKQRYEQLKAFKHDHGHTRVPREWKPNPSLGEWCHTQRNAFKRRDKCMTESDRVKLLNDIDFEWNAEWRNIKSWDERFEELVQFRRNHGHCDVPPVEEITYKDDAPKKDGEEGGEEEAKDEENGTSTSKEDMKKRINEKRAFSRWVQRQRSEHIKWKEGKKCQLDKHRIKKLEAIGFDWGEGRRYLSTHSTSHVPWETRIEQLKRYHAANGHVKVPQKYSGEKNLGNWVTQMRQIYRKWKKGEGIPATMTDDRFNELTKLGFVWNINIEPYNRLPWPARYQQLIEYKNAKGNTRVPQGWKENPQLATWVNEQRRQYKFRELGKYSSMKDDRIAQLEAIGFEWSVQSHRRIGANKDEGEHDNNQVEDGVHVAVNQPQALDGHSQTLPSLGHDPSTGQALGHEQYSGAYEYGHNQTGQTIGHDSFNEWKI